MQQSNENGEITLAVRDSIDETMMMAAHIQDADKDQKTSSVVFMPIVITQLLANGIVFAAKDGFPKID